MLKQKSPDLQPKPSMLDIFLCVYIVTKGEFQVCLWLTNAELKFSILILTFLL